VAWALQLRSKVGVVCLLGVGRGKLTWLVVPTQASDNHRMIIRDGFVAGPEGAHRATRITRMMV
jgi:hypothetical protein